MAPTTLDNPTDVGISQKFDSNPEHALAVKAPSALGSEQAEPRWRKRRRIKTHDLANTTSQLAIMTKSGMDVTSALKSAARQCQRRELSETLHKVHDEVMGGKSLSLALGVYSDLFGGAYVASVSAGEASGKLPEVLGHLAEMLRGETRLRSEVRGMLAYPLILTSVSGLVVFALIVFVLPQFAKIFSDYEMTLPVLTQIFIGIANELRMRFWVWCPLSFAAIAGLSGLRLTSFGKQWLDRAVLEMFLIRDVTRTLFVGRLCRLLGLMVDSGVPLLESLQLARATVSNWHYADLISRMEHSVLNGKGLGHILMECKYVPHSASEMVTTAEQTGNLAMVAQMIGAHFEEEGQRRLRECVTLAEPVITVVMGVFVAAVVLAVMLPMFDLATLSQH